MSHINGTNHVGIALSWHTLYATNGVVHHCMLVLIKAPATQVREGGIWQVQKREGGEREAI